MTFEQLEILVSVADTGSFSETAFRLYSTQPTISRQIRLLEEELGLELLQRKGRNVVLTASGKHVYHFAEQVQQQKERLLQELTPLLPGRKLPLNILVSPAVTSRNVIQLVAGFQKEHPEVAISLNEMNSDLLLPTLASKGCDFAFARQVESDAQCEMIPFGEDSFVAVVPLDDPLADKGVISLRDLQDRPFIALSKPNTNFTDLVIEFCREQGFTPPIACTAVQLNNLLEMVAAGFGVAILIRSTMVGEKRVAPAGLRFGSCKTTAVSIRSMR